MTFDVVIQRPPDTDGPPDGGTVARTKPPAPSSWRSRRLVLLLPTLAFTVSTLPGVRPHPGYDPLLDGGLANLGYLGAAVLCLLRSRQDDGALQRGGARLLAGAIALYGAGNLGWGLLIRPREHPSVPNPADLCWLAFYPLAFAALLVVARGVSAVRRPWLDGVVAGLAVFTVTAAAAGPAVGWSSGRWLTAAVLLAYPLCDAALLLVVTVVVAGFGWRPPAGLWFLSAGLALFVVADLAHLVGAETFTQGGPVDALWVVAVALMALAPGWPAVPVGPRLPRGWLLVVPVLATATALTLLLLDHLRTLSDVAVAAAATTVAAALVRLVVTLREVAALAHSRDLAHTDDLTGLGNRRALYAGGPAAIAACEPGGSVGLLLMDVDRFKEINDSLGHGAGDAMLLEVGQRLRRSSRSGTETVVRLGGDEFAVLLPDVTSEAAHAVAERLAAAVAEPLSLDGSVVRARVSIGIALLPAHEADVSTLLRQADVAMYHAKLNHLGRAGYHPDIDEFGSGDRLLTVELLRTAIAERSLVLHYQPKVDCATGELDGVEALVRWPHPERGLLHPDAFLPLAQSSGLMEELTRAVLEQALDQAADWRARGREVSVAVNLSASSLLDEGLPLRVAGMLSVRALPPRLLQVEITEDFLMADRVRAQSILRGLREQGVKVAVDDYGTGYSSLAYLRELPLDDLKLDRSFVAGMSLDARALAIVRSTIVLAHSLGLRLVAEGVEDEETERELTASGCDVQQGWFHAKALPPDALDEWLARHDARVLARGAARWPDVQGGGPLAQE